MTVSELLDMLQLIVFMIGAVIVIQFIIMADLSFIHSKLADKKVEIWGHKIIGFAMLGIAFYIFFFVIR